MALPLVFARVKVPPDTFVRPVLVLPVAPLRKRLPGPSLSSPPAPLIAPLRRPEPLSTYRRRGPALLSAMSFVIASSEVAFLTDAAPNWTLPLSQSVAAELNPGPPQSTDCAGPV